MTACSIDKVRYTPDDGDDDGSGGRTTAMVTVQLTGDGHGTIMAQGTDFACGASCLATVPLGATITLVATPDTGAVFGGWTGADCTGETCTVTASADLRLSARFDVQRFTVDVELLGSGMGVVTSSAGGLVCPGMCSVQVAYGTQLAFTAAPDSSSVFLGWSGDCGDGLCGFTVKEDRHVGATFAKQNELVVVKAGNGGGAVKSDPAGIDCGTDCSEAYQMGTSVKLTAVADADSTFTGWDGGGCSGTGTCTVTMAAATQVTATFVLQKRTLTVAKAGNGKGAVTSNPAGIDCGVDCTEDYDIHTPVTLVAAADGDSTFTGWSGGGCTGTGTCMVTLDANTTVTATFVLQKRTLTVTKAGNGTGAVTSNPAGINCGASCSASYDAHTVVTLTATPAVDSTFTGWSGGGCSGTGTCAVTLDVATTVTATFVLQKRSLVIGKAGNGTVTSNPAGINCGTDCNEDYDVHTVVTLTATPASDSLFSGWSIAACGSAPTCTVTLDASMTVTATFAFKQFTLTVAIAGSGTGTVAASGIVCPGDCSESYQIGTVVALTAQPSSGSTFAGWTGGGCGMASTCQVTMTADLMVTAKFDPPKGVIVVGNYTNPGSVSFFPITANGDVAPLRTIAGSNTTLQNVRGLAVAGSELFVVDQGGRAIDVFPVTADGNVAPSRRIFGANTQFVTMSGLSIYNGELYVSQQSSQVLVFPLDANGDVAPARKISLSVTASIQYSAIANGELFLASTTEQILVVPVTASGGVTPTRIISGVKGLSGIAISNGEIFAGTLNLAPSVIYVYPLDASGAATPTRTITGASTQLSQPDQIVVLNGEIFAANYGGASATVHPTSGNGDVAPTRRIAGSSTKIQSPTGIAVY